MKNFTVHIISGPLEEKISNVMGLPIYTEVQFALVFELRQQLLFRLLNSHAFSEHSVQKELTGLSKQNTHF